MCSDASIFPLVLRTFARMCSDCWRINLLSHAWQWQMTVFPSVKSICGNDRSLEPQYTFRGWCYQQRLGSSGVDEKAEETNLLVSYTLRWQILEREYIFIDKSSLGSSWVATWEWKILQTVWSRLFLRARFELAWKVLIGSTQFAPVSLAKGFGESKWKAKCNLWISEGPSFCSKACFGLRVIVVSVALERPTYCFSLSWKHITTSHMQSQDSKCIILSSLEAFSSFTTVYDRLVSPCSLRYFVGNGRKSRLKARSPRGIEANTESNQSNYFIFAFWSSCNYSRKLLKARVQQEVL